MCTLSIIVHIFLISKLAMFCFAIFICANIFLKLASVLSQCPLVRLKDLQPQAARPTLELSSLTGIIGCSLVNIQLPSVGPMYVLSGAWTGLIVGPDEQVSISNS